MPSTYSPFRYPGGKSQLYPFVANLISINSPIDTYIEPFAGGSGAALKLLFNNNVKHIIINDFDPSIYSVWWTILNHPKYLIDKILSVPFDYYSPGIPENNIAFWKSQHQIFMKTNNDPHSLEGAFSTLFLNRTNRSGIITGGPLGGWTQRNTLISARFNKQTLIKKISAIYKRRGDITILKEDALLLIPKITQYYAPQTTFIFFDPPYFDQGSHLYFSSLNRSDHQKLAKLILSLRDYKWIVTYDKNPFIWQLYAQASGRYEYFLNYSANSHNRGKSPEFLFSSSHLQIEPFGKTKLITQ